jgi:uridine kinase
VTPATYEGSVTTARRRRLLDRLARDIVALPSNRPRIVAIDGVDGAGKTMLADELATDVRAAGRPVLRAGVDGFHRPRAARYARGRGSPQGYYLDSYDYPTLLSVLLEPFVAGEPVCPAVWEHISDTPVPRRWQPVELGAVLIFDGIFLHRPELRDRWDLSIFCRVDPATSCARMAVRDGTPADPADPANRRYVEGQRSYLDACDPEALASYVVDNTDLAAPYVVER